MLFTKKCTFYKYDEIYFVYYRFQYLDLFNIAISIKNKMAYDRIQYTYRTRNTHAR